LLHPAHAGAGSVDPALRSRQGMAEHVDGKFDLEYARGLTWRLTRPVENASDAWEQGSSFEGKKNSN
jgi:hypothetical protein